MIIAYGFYNSHRIVTTSLIHAAKVAFRTFLKVGAYRVVLSSKAIIEIEVQIILSSVEDNDALRCRATCQLSAVAEQLIAATGTTTPTLCVSARRQH